MESDRHTLFGREGGSPGEVMRRLLEEKGWTQEHLAQVTGRSRQQIIDIANDQRGISADMAIALAVAFKTTPDYWMRLDASHRLSTSTEDAAAVQKRVKVFEFAPIREMQRRGWITDTRAVGDIEKSLCSFFEIDSLDQTPEFPVAARKSLLLSDFTPAQRAWVFRARHLARALPVPAFNPEKVSELKRELRIHAAYPAEAGRVADVLRRYGIRFVVVEPLPGMRMDGAAFWIDENSPAIAMSLFQDRIDNFWFVLMHEVAHIEHGDAISVDVDLSVEGREQPLMKDAIERRADEAAANTLVPHGELDSFIRRVGPIYAAPNIIQFAHRIKIHPGIIVGQLQHRAEIGFNSNRKMLPKIRHFIVSTALADGWGNAISPDVI